MDIDFKKEIPISVSDLSELLYFSLLKFNEDNLHRSGNSSKRDAFGGYLERWLNRIVETKIFEHIISIAKKNYSVCPDNYIYVQGHEKNAPDILGLQNDDKLFSFGYFENNSWVQKNNYPIIEVKAIRKSQHLLAVRDNQKSDYYCFVEVDFREDYITSFFNKNLFSRNIYDKIISKMQHSIFLKGNENNKIILEPEYINFSEEVGKIKLIGIFSDKIYKKYSTFINSNCSPFYLSEIDLDPKRVPGRGNLKYKNNIYDLSINSITKQYEDETYISVLASKINNLKVISDKSKSSLYFEVIDDINMFGKTYKRNDIIKLSYKIFERTSKWNEYIGLKKDFFNNVPDSTNELLDKFDEIIQS